MDKPDIDLRPRPPQEISAIIRRAIDEEWRELAIVTGGRSFAGVFHNMWRRESESPNFVVSRDSLSNQHIDLLSQMSSADQLWLIGQKLSADGARALAALTNLTTLDLTSNQIGDDGARALAALTNLTSLNLDLNQIGADGARALAALTNLTSLNLTSNQIGADGARALAALTNLTSLNLDLNQIGDDGARALAALTNLTSLNLTSNQIGDDGARALSSLTNLTSLNLYDNRIGDDGARALSSLTNLTSLNLDLNQIGDDGARALAALTNLTSLNLTSNQIGDDGARAILEAWASRVDTAELHCLDLRGNGDISGLLPADALKQTDAKKLVAAYRQFRAAAAAGKLRPLNEAKLLVVGEEAVGKTSLVKFLVHDEPRDDSEEKTTGVAMHERIETQQWRAEARSEVTLNIWDFGGQEIMHGTHRYFLTARSLYLIVLDNRREDDKSVHRWLERIKSLGGASPVLIVINKCDLTESALRLDETGLKDKYRNIVDFYRTSCNDTDDARKLIADLRTAIAKTLAGDAMKHVRDPVPDSWHRVKETVVKKAAKLSVLPLSEFRRICAHGGRRNAVRIKNNDDQDALLSTLHNMGKIVAHGLGDNRAETKPEVTLLDPNWLTTAIYTLLNASQLIHNHGELTRTDMAQLLDRKAYPQERHGFILDMMQQPEIGLCFPLDAEKTRYLVPEALPKNTPPLQHWQGQDALRLRFCYRTLPKNLLPRFIVQAQDKFPPDPIRWRTGCILTSTGNGECEMLVVADTDNKRLDIAVTGPIQLRRSALHTVWADLETVHKLWHELAAQVFVPMPDNPEVMESYEHLRTLEDEEGPDYKHRPTGAKRSYRVGDLLSGVERAERYRPTLDNSVFVSYSWGKESSELVDEIEAAFAGKDIQFIRDRNELGYKAPIGEFMQRIGRAKAIIVVLSKAYLESPNCMFELTQIASHGELRERTYPVVMPDAEIYDPVTRIKYIKYWETKKSELNAALQEVGAEHLDGFRDDIDLYANIRTTIAGILDILRDTNALNLDQHRARHFADILEALE